MFKKFTLYDETESVASDSTNPSAMIWIAIHTAFGFECVISDDLNWVCEKAGISKVTTEGKYVEGLKYEVWNGKKLWVVEQADVSRLGFIIMSHMESRKSKF